MCGDVDRMVLNNNTPHVLFESPAKGHENPKCGYVLAELVHKRPAYLTLKAPPGVEYTDMTTNQSLLDMSSLHQTGWRILASAMFTKYSYLVSSLFIRGPAMKALVDPFQPDLGLADVVPCLTCDQWPMNTKRFFHRHRPHGWPSLDLLRKIKASGFHVVPVGHPNSPSKDLEWRLSFSVAERELIQAVSDVKFGCMYLLKVIKKHHWKGKDSDLCPTPTLFCSYYIKTACLWIWEVTPEDVNTLELCRAVLDWLIACYHDNKLPHYFIPKQNLLDHITKDQCKEVSDWLVQIKSNIYTICLSSLHGDIWLQKVQETKKREMKLTRNYGWKKIISKCCTHERGEQIIQDGTKCLAYGTIRKHPRHNNDIFKTFFLIVFYIVIALINRSLSRQYNIALWRNFFGLRS